VESYVYDGQNWRVMKTAGGTVWHDYYTSQWQIVEERVGSSTSPNEQHVWGLLGVDNYVVQIRAGGVLYPLSAPNASITALVYSAAVIERYGYESFGQPRFMDAGFGSKSGTSFQWYFLYDGCRWDEQSGFYQMRNRYLHPTLGRWLTRDPIGYEGGINLYAYCGNNSVNRVDPMGMDPPHSTQGGDDPGHDPDQKDQALDDARKVLRDPKATAKQRSKARARIQELSRKPSKAQGSGSGGHHCKIVQACIDNPVACVGIVLGLAALAVLTAGLAVPEEAGAAAAAGTATAAGTGTTAAGSGAGGLAVAGAGA